MFVAKEYNINKKCTKLLYPHERFTPCLCTCAGLFLLFNIQFLLIAKRPSMWQRAEWLPTLFNQVRFLVFWRCIEHVNFALSFVCGASSHFFFFFFCILQRRYCTPWEKDFLGANCFYIISTAFRLASFYCAFRKLVALIDCVEPCNFLYEPRLVVQMVQEHCNVC